MMRMLQDWPRQVSPSYCLLWESVWSSSSLECLLHLWLQPSTASNCPAINIDSPALVMTFHKTCLQIIWTCYLYMSVKYHFRHTMFCMPCPLFVNISFIYTISFIAYFLFPCIASFAKLNNYFLWFSSYLHVLCCRK